jgi:type IV secretory pathway VirB3-like protein
MIRRDPLFKGLTRKAMIFGVPMFPLFCVIAVLLMTAAIWSAVSHKATGYVFAIVTAFPIVGIMRLMVKHDEDKFKLIGMWITSRMKEKNFRHWKAVSYGTFDASFRKRKGL